MHSPAMQTGNSERHRVFGILVFTPSRGAHCHQVESRKLRLLRAPDQYPIRRAS
jgi:hypothetical protein